MSRIATAENAADYEIIVVATTPYDFRFYAHIGQFRPSAIGGSFYFPAT